MMDLLINSFMVTMGFLIACIFVAESCVLIWCYGFYRHQKKYGLKANDMTFAQFCVWNMTGIDIR